MDDKLLYHASHIGIIGDIAPISRSDCDFGRGFYLSNRPNQTFGLVLNDENPHKYTFVLNETKDELKVLRLKGEDWFYTVLYNRGALYDFIGTDLYDKYSHILDGYDVVIGQIADDSLAKAIVQFLEGSITDVVALNCIKEVNIGTQIVLKTQKACDALTMISESKLTAEDRIKGENFKDWKNDKAMGIIARMNIQYKGEGLYYSEILDRERELNKEDIDYEL